MGHKDKLSCKVENKVFLFVMLNVSEKKKTHTDCIKCKESFKTYLCLIDLKSCTVHERENL